MRTAKTLWTLALWACVTSAQAQELEVTFEDSALEATSEVEREAMLGEFHRVFGELEALLSGLPATVPISVQAGDRVIPSLGVGGSANSSTLSITFFFDPDHEQSALELTRAHLTRILFHEGHHLARMNLVDSVAEVTFLEFIVSEGLGTVFERDFAKVTPLWGDYPPDVADWVEELLALPEDEAWDDYEKWAFRHPDGRKWILYRAGTYIADRAIERSGLSAAELVGRLPEEILQLAGIR